MFSGINLHKHLVAAMEGSTLKQDRENIDRDFSNGFGFGHYVNFDALSQFQRYKCFRFGRPYCYFRLWNSYEKVVNSNFKRGVFDPDGIKESVPQ